MRAVARWRSSERWHLGASLPAWGPRVRSGVQQRLMAQETGLTERRWGTLRDALLSRRNRSVREGGSSGGGELLAVFCSTGCHQP